jgi:hypothetical protein
VSDLRQVIFTAVATVIRKQSVLFTIPVDEGSPNAYFARLNSIDITRSVTLVTRSQSRLNENEYGELDALLQDYHNTSFRSEYGTLPSWRLLIIPDFGSRNAFTASFIFHDAIGDGELIFHKEFQTALNAAPLADLPFDASSTVIPTPDSITLLPLEDLNHVHHPLPYAIHLTDFVMNPDPSMQEAWTVADCYFPIYHGHGALRCASLQCRGAHMHHSGQSATLAERTRQCRFHWNNHRRLQNTAMSF